MAEALRLAERGRGKTAPNPMVGCVIVRRGKIIGRGFHRRAGGPHAEIEALRSVHGGTRGATVYVTLEPCNHHGRTGPCVDALLAAEVGRVVVALRDPNPQVKGGGVARLRRAGVDVTVGVGEPETRRQLAAWICWVTTGRPLVTLKAAVTLDGKIAAPEDGTPGFTPGWITSEEARKHVQTLRHRSDAILTGIGTVMADDCLLTDRTGEERSRPLLRIVLDSLLRIRPESRMVSSAKRDVLVITTSAASADRRKKLEDLGVRVEVLEDADGRADLRAVVELLAREKVLSLMIEAGSRVNWTALESGVADKIFFYYAPKILGGTQSVPVAGGAGRRRRVDAIQFENVQLHQITSSEFAVEAWLQKGHGGAGK